MAKEIPVIAGHERQVAKLVELRQKLAEVQGEADLIENRLKEAGTAAVTAFGSVEFAGDGGVRYQVQVRRPSISINSDNMQEAKKVLGGNLPYLFNITVGDEEVINMDELKAFVLKHGGKVEKFFRRCETGTAKDTFLDQGVAAKIVGKTWAKTWAALEPLLTTRKGAVAGKMVIK